MNIDFQKIATDAVNRGFAVIPLQPGMKDPDYTLIPRINNEPGTGGAARRTRDLEQIAWWAADSPNANVGVCSDELVTILESDDEPKFRQLVRDVSRSLLGASHELPVTLTSQARAGRPHFFFQATPKTNAIKEAPAVQGLFEWRHKNQYVVGPGSLHPTGVLYTIINDVPMIPMPDWLVDVLKEIQRAYRGQESRANSFVRVGPAATARDALLNRYALDPDAMLDDDSFELHITAGERHYFLQSMAGLLHDGYRTEAELEDVLKRMRDKYCEAGKGDYEVENLASWTIRQTPSTVEPNLPPMIVGKTIYSEPPVFEAAREVYEDWGSLFHTYEETVDAKPLRYVIENFLQEDSLTMFGGPPAAMKTYVALVVARALITGDPLFDYFQVNEKAKRVLYLIPESSLAPFAARLKKLDMVKHVGKTFFYRTLDVETELIDGIKDPRLLKAAEGADVFLDTAVRFMDGDENAASEQRVFARNLFAMLKAGARTVTGLHHSPKDFKGKQEMTLENMLRGSGDIGAMLATGWGFAKIDDERSQIYVKNIKDRDFTNTPEPFILEARPHLDESGKFKLLHAPGSAPDYKSVRAVTNGKKGGRPEAISEEVAQKILALRAAGHTHKAIADAFGISTKSVQRLLNEKGLVQ